MTDAAKILITKINTNIVDLFTLMDEQGIVPFVQNNNSGSVIFIKKKNLNAEIVEHLAKMPGGYSSFDLDILNYELNGRATWPVFGFVYDSMNIYYRYGYVTQILDVRDKKDEVVGHVQYRLANLDS